MTRLLPRRWLHGAGLLGVTVLGLAGAAGDVAPSTTNAPGRGVAPAAARRGRALFSGGAALTGRIRGHQSGLPPEVVRCANCHALVSGDSTRGAAPPIERALLLETRSRRGGPPSAYDRKTFCSLLRTGVDPVSVLVAREMPTYDINDADCADIWAFLTQAESGTDRPPQAKGGAAP